MSRFLPVFILTSGVVLGVAGATAQDSAATTTEKLNPASLPKDSSAEQAMMLGAGGAPESMPVDDTADTLALADVEAQDNADDQEEIWVEISDAIESLNEVVGDKMFLDLRRKNASEMEVRVDAGFWQRVRYQTRVDLKNDISNIWHLYVKQYYEGEFSSVRFVDDTTDKTIDIFTQTR